MSKKKMQQQKLAHSREKNILERKATEAKAYSTHHDTILLSFLSLECVHRIKSSSSRAQFKSKSRALKYD